jgi:hypothetical protein
MKINSKTNQLNLRGLFKMLMLCAAIGLVFTSCMKNDYSNYQTQPTAALNVVHASPGTASFNFALDNNFVNGPALLYGQRSGYLNAYAGKRLFSLTSGGSTQVVATDTMTLVPNNYYSLFITGLNTAPTFFLTQDDLTAPAPGKAKIRFAQLSPTGAILIC